MNHKTFRIHLGLHLLLLSLALPSFAAKEVPSQLTWFFISQQGANNYTQSQSKGICKVTQTTDNGRSIFIAYLNLKPGAYLFTADVRTNGSCSDGGGAWCELFFPELQNWPPTENGGRSMPVATGGKWKPIRQVVRVPDWEKAKNQQMLLGLRNFKGSAEFRNMRLEPLPETSPYLIFADRRKGSFRMDLEEVLPGRRYRTNFPVAVSFFDVKNKPIVQMDLKANEKFTAPENFGRAEIAFSNPSGQWFRIDYLPLEKENFDWKLWNSWTMYGPEGKGSVFRDFELTELPSWAVGGFCTFGEILVNGKSLGLGDPLPAHGGRRYIDLLPLLKKGKNRIELRFGDGPRAHHFFNVDIELLYAGGNSNFIISSDGLWKFANGTPAAFIDCPDRSFVMYEKPWVMPAAIPDSMLPRLSVTAKLELKSADVVRGVPIAGQMTLKLPPKSRQLEPRFVIDWINDKGKVEFSQSIFPPAQAEAFPIELSTEFLRGGRYTLKLDSRYNAANDNRLAEVTIASKTLPLPKVRVDLSEGRPVVAVDRQRLPAVLFFARAFADTSIYKRYWEQDCYNMRKDGVRIFCAMGELGSDMEKDVSSSLGSIWTGPGQYNFTALDKEIMRLLSAVPDAYIFLMLRCDDPVWRKKSAQEEMITLASGRRHHSVSMSSDSWAKETCEAIRATMKHLMEQPYAHRLIGCHLIAGYDGQWLIYNDYSKVPEDFSDYSKIAQNAFALWQKQNFPDRKEPETVPAPAERIFRNFYVPDPESNRRRLEYYRFLGEQLCHRVDQFLSAVKEGTNGQLLAGTYFYPNHGETSRVGQEQRQEAPQLYDLENFNFSALPIHYVNRNLEHSGILWTGIDRSFDMRGIMRILEDDYRTYMLEGYKILWYGNHTVYGTIASMRRSLAQRLSLGQAHWYLDMYGHWFASPPIRELINLELSLMRAADGFKRLPELDAAAVDVYGMRVLNHKRSNTAEDILHLYVYTGHESWEYPVDMLYVGDLNHPKRLPYKLWFFRNLVALSPEERAKIDSLKKDGNVLVFSFTTGYSDMKTISSENMERLIGIRVKPDLPLETFKDIEWNFARGGDQILKGIAGSNAQTSFLMPRFYVDDPQAVPLGYFTDGKVAAAIRRYPDYTVVYLCGGTPARQMPMLLASNLAREAKVPVMVTGDPLVLRSGSRFVSAYCSISQATSIVHIPGNYAAYDVFDDRIIPAAEASAIDLKLKRGDTKLYFVGSEAEIAEFRSRLGK